MEPPLYACHSSSLTAQLTERSTVGQKDLQEGDESSQSFVSSDMRSEKYVAQQCGLL
jgi:hypothetical protein